VTDGSHFGQMILHGQFAVCIDAEVMDAVSWAEQSVLAIFARLDRDTTHMGLVFRHSTADDRTCTMSRCHLRSSMTSKSTVCRCCQVSSCRVELSVISCMACCSNRSAMSLVYETKQRGPRTELW